jgi:hypothetical protein
MFFRVLQAFLVLVIRDASFRKENDVKVLGIILGLLLGLPALYADTIHLQNGGTLEGVILKDSPVDGLVIRLKYATVSLTHSDIASIEKTPPAAAPGKLTRLARWDRCYQAIVARPWGPDLRAVPAFVIESGVLANVPYLANESGEYLVNIYGDPESPASVEVGLSGSARKIDQKRKECLELLSQMLEDSRDAAVLRTLGLQGEKKESSGLILQTSLEGNAKGEETWWISVYDPKALDLSRISDKELASMTSVKDPAPSGSGNVTQAGSRTPGTVATPSDQNFGFSQNALSGTENPPPTRSYSRGGRVWRGYHFPHGLPKPQKPK